MMINKKYLAAAALLLFLMPALAACGKKDTSGKADPAASAGTISVQAPSNDTGSGDAGSGDAVPAGDVSGNASSAGDVSNADVSGSDDSGLEDRDQALQTPGDEADDEQTFDEDSGTVSGWGGTYEGVSGEVLTITEDGSGILFSFRNSGISGDASVEENSAVYSGMDGYTLQFQLSGSNIEVTATDGEGNVDSQTAVSGSYSRQ